MEDQTETNQQEAETEVDNIKPAFLEAVEAGKDEDAIKLAMITAGATFKNVTRLYNAYMIDAGLAVSKEDKETALEAAVEGADLSAEDEFATAVEALVEGLAGTTERSAAALIRAYAKKNELECWAKPKGTGAPRDSFASKFYDFLVGNPTMTVEEATAYIMGTGEHAETSPNVQKNKPHYLGVHSLASRVAASL